MFRVIVAGSRSFANYELLAATLDKLLARQLPQVLIVSGGANGADRLGERYAWEHGLEFVRFVPDWDLLGRRAGFLRNEVMAQNADALVAFWLRNSAGTGHMIDIARRRRIPTRVIRPE